MVEAQFLFEHVSDPIILVDREFRVIRVNPSFCKLFAVDEKHVVGKKSCDVFKELDFSQCNEACMRVVQKEVEGGKWVEVPDEHCPHFDYAYPIFDENGRLREAMLILKSARLKRRTRRAADELESKDEMLATIYHDLASPLQVIRACTDVMAMELEENPAAKKDLMQDMLEASKRNERRLYEMVRTIRMIPRLEEEDAFSPESVQPAELIESICSDFRLVLRGDVKLEWNVAAELPDVMIEPSLLSRVFFNLLDNAARYTRQGGCIAVAAKCKPGDTHVTFTVFDDGDAVRPEFLPHMFQKNLVIDRKSGLMKTRRDHGWGLYFCRLTVERFGGSIKVESREGWGTRFVFTLPVAPRA
ncbi:MAG: PAS domain-containing sensor histidine kinase [Candidatus Abyssobacteria bacterium SURF_17]|jgi:signal transduction histidine kinase|uniref:histidine kinase n=1 Tax=Candidatus Abyssobacteria bacterium SURF_17 TaxID=2093361 RepID=A0A419F9E3_9BACT|nr:MAG: PAS domain-containing sensor histidine kinase [Candidatus Abyssubacteria bacterium SURF_17]